MHVIVWASVCEFWGRNSVKGVCVCVCVGGGGAAECKTWEKFNFYEKGKNGNLL